jgi:outer membrane protein assembly factor BamD (BamD/ComL family)
MKKIFVLVFSLAVMLCGASAASAQGSARREPDPAVLRDPLMERDSKHNLDAARQYFKLKKAYRASLSRAEEIIAGYPNFSLIDEALYIAGMSNLYLSQSKGKQPPTLPVEKHRDEARMYLSRVVNEYPESSFRKDAEKALESVGGLQKIESKQ